MAKHYVSEMGTDILLDLGIDLTDIDEQFVMYKKPDGTTIGSWTGAVYSSYSEIVDGIGKYFVKYTLEADDIDQSGEWNLQARVANATGTWYGETADETFFAAFN